MVKLNISQLDFESNKQQFKDYLKSQTQFKDYNFEGSNMSVLLDVLAYNTFQNNFYTNMAINEMFLDSASLRNSIVSHAKELNYLPRSRRSAKAVVNVTFKDATITGQTITIPQYAVFTAEYKGDNFEFVTDKAFVAKKVAIGTFLAENVEIFEGVMLSSFEREGYFVDAEGILRVILSNENADTDSIAVFVDAEATEDENVFTRKNDIFGVEPLDKVFYIEPYVDGRYTIYFGNNVFGFQPNEFEDVRVRYRITSGVEGNGVPNFEYATDFGTAQVETIQIAAGGDERETAESIKFYAPKALQIQERAVTTSDYEIILKTKFPEIKSVAAYGGEQLEPPQFGKVAIAVYLGDGQESLSATLSRTYINYLSDRSPLAIEPVFTPAKFIYGCATIDVYYNANLTTKSSGDLETSVRNIVSAYASEKLDDFNTTFRSSKVSTLVDNADTSIQSNAICVQPFIEYSPTLNVNLNPSFKFDAELVKPYPYKETNGFTSFKPSIQSSVYVLGGQNVNLQDDGNGKIQIITASSSDPEIVNPNIGSVDYTTGEVKLINFKTSGFNGAAIRIMATTKLNDVTAPSGRIFVLKDTDVTINLVGVN
jgi:hypothetical protein